MKSFNFFLHLGAKQNQSLRQAYHQFTCPTFITLFQSVVSSLHHESFTQYLITKHKDIAAINLDEPLSSNKVEDFKNIYEEFLRESYMPVMTKAID